VSLSWYLHICWSRSVRSFWNPWSNRMAVTMSYHHESGNPSYVGHCWPWVTVLA
jgi:hypothetical protein